MPQEAPHLFTYIGIRDLSIKLWRDYDREFRQIKAVDPNLSYLKIDTDILYNILPIHPAHAAFSGLGGHPLLAHASLSTTEGGAPTSESVEKGMSVPIALKSDTATRTAISCPNNPNPTPIHLNRFLSFLSSYPPQLKSFLYNLRFSVSSCTNHKSALLHPHLVNAKISKEIALGRMSGSSSSFPL